MKKFLLLFVLGLSLGALQAQSYGIKGGLNLANVYSESALGTQASTDNLLSFHVGVTAEMELSAPFYLNSGLFFSQKGYNQEILTIQLTQKVNYIQLPLNFMFKYDFNEVQFFAEAGPYAAFAISGKTISGSTTTEVDFGPDAGQRDRFDAGLGFGGGVNVMGLQIGANYSAGLLNLSNTDDTKFTNNVLQISVAYLIK